MSFGDGDLHIENKRLYNRIEELKLLNGELCAETNAKDREIAKLRTACGVLLRDLQDLEPALARRRAAKLGLEA